MIKWSKPHPPASISIIMRIISGKYGRGGSLCPKFQGRPTTDMAKEGLLSLLENRLELGVYEGAESFAGTGV